MIISGIMDSIESLHEHCEVCIKAWRCNVRPQDDYSCEIVFCGLNCGARFHRCKDSEHALLCPNHKVHCINKNNGCPVVLLRSKVGKHLETCPASVVRCTMEWNRWPVNSAQEYALHLPLKAATLPEEQTRQLDIALAMRDQRMLNQWFQAPQKTKQMLKNSLTKRYPAVPFNVHQGADGSSVDTLDNLANGMDSSMHKVPVGLQQSICQELYKASLKTTECVCAALNAAQLGYTDLNGFQEAKNDLQRTQRSSSERLSDSEHQFKDELMGVVENNREPSTETKMVRAMIDFLKSNSKHSEQLFVDNNIVSDISSASMIDHACQQPSPPPFVLHSNLAIEEDEKSTNFESPFGLNLTLESVTKYETKPKSMYTFLCAQNFRRDEYCWHYKNVHSDIHGGLNGWLEQRCPLANYGCTFSTRRFYPSERGSTIVHNNVLESFGILPPPVNGVHAMDDSCRESIRWIERSESAITNHEFCDKSVHKKTRNEQEVIVPQKAPNSILDFPFEILQEIFRCLDSFSLCNVALTCHLFREVCRSLLEERGLVVLRWKRIKIGDKYSWRVAYKSWLFSTAFTPVSKWSFEPAQSIGSHLQTCPFMKPEKNVEPFFYPFGIKPNAKVLTKLRSNIPGCNGAEKS